MCIRYICDLVLNIIYPLRNDNLLLIAYILIPLLCRNSLL